MISQPSTNATLQDIYTLQRNIMEKYIVLEDLPRYPLDLSKRTNQKILKDFAYRIIEELSEANDSLVKGYEAISTNHSEEAQEFITDYNTELADVIHYMMEVMIFSGMDEYFLSSWLGNYGKDNPQMGGMMVPGNMFQSFAKMAELLNYLDDKAYQKKDRNTYIIFTEGDVSVTPEIGGGRKLSYKSMEDHALFMWEITRRLTMAMNCLKTRDWHTEENMVVNITNYSDGIMESFVALFRLFAYTGKSELSVYNSYLLKNKINWERFKNTVK